MSTGIPKTNYLFIHSEFDDEIYDLRDGAAGLINNPPGAIRKTIVFNDLTKLSCQEVIKDGIIDFYHYDFYDDRGNIIMKFHSEPHDDEDFQTETEPFHMHVKSDENDLKASKRVKNKHLQELYNIMVFIVNGQYLKHAFIKVAPSKKKKK